MDGEGYPSWGSCRQHIEEIVCSLSETNARLMRWYLALQPFAFTVRHRAGRHHANTDALSRLGIWEETSPGGRELDLRAGECSREGWFPSERDPEGEPNPPWLLEPKRRSPDRKQGGGTRPLEAGRTPPDRKQGGGARPLKRQPASSVRRRRPREKEASPWRLHARTRPEAHAEGERPVSTPDWGLTENLPESPVAWESDGNPPESPAAQEPEEDPPRPPAAREPEEDRPELYRVWDTETLPAAWGPQDLEELPSEEEPMELPELPPVDEEGLMGLLHPGDPEESGVTPSALCHIQKSENIPRSCQTQQTSMDLMPLKLLHQKRTMRVHSEEGYLRSLCLPPTHSAQGRKGQALHPNACEQM